MRRVSALLLALMLCGCNLSLNSDPPEYIKQFSAYKEGDGLMMYFVLADASGNMTTHDGQGLVEIRASHYDSRDELRLLDIKFEVKKEKFRRADVGMGAFKHEVILFPIGRVSFQSFNYTVDDLKEGNWKGKVRLEISSEGRVFKADETFYF
jgi:hypothetical protein